MDYKTNKQSRTVHALTVPSCTKLSGHTAHALTVPSYFAFGLRDSSFNRQLPLLLICGRTA